jgi:hypothetical protein
MTELKPEDHAKLPAVYSAAKAALAKCESLDECKDWSDKAAALASYAKQAKDDELLNHARRIQIRAVDRMGELLKAIPAQPGKRTDLEPGRDAPTRLQTGAGAGLSKDQAVTAVRVNNVPRDAFERQVESDKPATITALARQGTKSAPIESVTLTASADKPEPEPIVNNLRATADFMAKTDLRTLLRYVADRAPGVALERAFAVMTKEELQEANELYCKISAWLDKLQKAAQPYGAKATKATKPKIAPKAPEKKKPATTKARSQMRKGQKFTEAKANTKKAANGAKKKPAAGHDQDTKRAPARQKP